MHTIRFGTRRSSLAMTQTEWTIDQLRTSFPDLTFETKKIVTKGDRILHVTLSKVGGKGLFVKEIEQALLNGEVDVAVHSMKDMPAEMADGLTLAAICKREDPRDCFISREGETLDELPAGAVVGTSSLRRQAQLQAHRPDLKVEPVRGNIETRLRKMREGQFAAIVLASAGLHRMGWHEIITEYLDTDISLPAVGQGAIGLQCRKDDAETRSLLQTLNDETTAQVVQAERAFLHRMDGNCQIPIGAYGILEEDEIELTGLVADPEGPKILRELIRGTDPEHLGQQVAERLIDMGADKILASLRESAQNG